MGLNYFNGMEGNARIFVKVIQISLLAMVIACIPVDKPRMDSTSGPKTQPTPEDVEIKGYRQDPRLNEVALFLSGRVQPPDSPLRKLAAKKQYQLYSKRVREAWARYETNHLSKIRAWRGHHLPQKNDYQEVFYPFSGPDITNALTFFPNARRYVLLALEYPADIPQPDPKRPGLTFQQLSFLPRTVEGQMGRIFFKTKVMAETVGLNNYSGIAAILMFYISGLGYEVIDGYRSTVNKDGRVVRDNYFYTKEGKRTRINGVTIFFRRHARAPVQQVVYHQLDIGDENLKFQPRFQKYLTELGPVVTMMKSASYLLYRASFDGMRSVIASRSKYILTDSSGIPFHYLNKPGWDLSYYGRYDKPIQLFHERHDPKMTRAFKKAAPVPMPFEYGYRSKSGDAHMVLATRSRGVEYRTPRFDPGSHIGKHSVYMPEMGRMIRIDARHMEKKKEVDKKLAENKKKTDIIAKLPAKKAAETKTPVNTTPVKKAPVVVPMKKKKKRAPAPEPVKKKPAANPQ